MTEPGAKPKTIGAEMAAGSWLVSLEFEARQLRATQVIRLPDGRPVWMYQAPFVPLVHAPKPQNLSRK